MTRWNFFDNLAQDLRFTIRQLSKNAGFTTTAILILALGLCASVAIFAFVDAALLRPLPYKDPTRLAGVYESIPQCPHCNLSYLDYLDWKKMNKVFSSLEVYTGTGFSLKTPTGVELAHAVRISDGFFRTLGVSPILGRDFHPGDDAPGAPPTVVLSHAVWQQRYGAKRDVIGQTVVLDDTPYAVIGVLPADFQFAPGGKADFWTPLNVNGSCEKRRSCHNLWGLGRLRDGVSIEAALADTKLIARQLEKQYPDSNRGQGAAVAPLSEVITGDIRPILMVLLGGASLLLLIACVNVSSLLLVRSESRRRELAVRSALGASRARIMSQFVTEGIVLVAASAALGLFSAIWLTQLLVRLIPQELLEHMPFVANLGMNWRVAAFAASISLLAALLFALTPALRASFEELRSGLAEGSRGSAGTTWRRLGSKLVIVELATAMVLLVSGGLLGQSLYRLLHVNLGFQPEHLAAVTVYAPPARYGKDPQAIELARRVQTRLLTLPGVEAAGESTLLPVSFNGNTTWIRFVGRPYNGEHNEVNEREVSAGYFAAIGAKIYRGRGFNDSEDQSKPGVVIINQALSQKYFPGQDPIGQQMGDTDLAPKSLKQIVGIVEDIHDGALDDEVWPTVYYPYNQSPDVFYSVAVRTTHDPRTLPAAMVAAIRELDPNIVTMDPVAFPERIKNSPSAYLHRSSAWLVGGFAGLALLLGVVGLYGVIAYSVSQRTREIGVRVALGAQRSDVHKLILKEAGILTAIGIAAGLVCSLAGATLLTKLLFGIQSWDIPTLLGVALLLSICAIAASFIPAHRAAMVNPVEALRSE